jgi:hypothetical protein
MKINSAKNWKTLSAFFPAGWEEKAKEFKALVRVRKFKSAGDLLRLLLIHIGDGCSAREAIERARQGNLADVSDVALLKRLRASSDWLQWMAAQMLRQRGVALGKPEWLSEYQVKSVDASVVSEPGATGSDWRLHYSVNLFGLQADQFVITRQEQGESFSNFKVEPGDLLIGDRAYGRLKGIKHIRKHGGEFLARLKNKAFRICDGNFKELGLFDILKPLKEGQILDRTIFAGAGEETKMKVSAPLERAIWKLKNQLKRQGEGLKKGSGKSIRKRLSFTASSF